MFRLIGAALLLFTLGLYVAYLVKVRNSPTKVDMRTNQSKLGHMTT